MLIYSSDDLLKLLPALPEELGEGEAKRLRYTDGSVDMRWNVAKGKFMATLTAIRDHSVRLCLPKAFSGYTFSGGQGAAIDPDGFVLLSLKGGETLTISAKQA